MQFRFTYLTHSFLIVATLFLFSACFKQFDEVDNLNTNMFDRDYKEDSWFDLDTAYYFVTPLGTSRVLFDISIRQDRLPSLKPSNIAVEFSTIATEPEIIDFPLSSGGIYRKKIDVPYTGSGEYCFQLGVLVPTDSTIINRFEGCASL